MLVRVHYNWRGRKGDLLVGLDFRWTDCVDELGVLGRGVCARATSFFLAIIEDGLSISLSLATAIGDVDGAVFECSFLLKVRLDASDGFAKRRHGCCFGVRRMGFRGTRRCRCGMVIEPELCYDRRAGMLGSDPWMLPMQLLV